MINIDLYGSRYTLIPLMRSAEELEFEISKAYLGSALTSQFAKTQKIDTKYVKKISNKYEELEILNDRLKLFRRFSSHSKSSTIVIDFLNEGYDVLNLEQGRITLTPASIKFDKNNSRKMIMSKETRIQDIENNLNTFINELDQFDKIILNKLRISKYRTDENGRTVLKDNIQEINVMNSVIESYEDLTLDKLNRIEIIPLYDNHEIEGYWFASEYLNHFKKHIDIFIEWRG